MEQAVEKENSMLTKLLALLSLGVIALLIWLPDNNTTNNNQQDDQELLPEFTAKMLHQELYDEQGQLHQKVISESMEHFKEISLTHFLKPDFTLYENQQPNWRIVAMGGTLQEGLLILDKQVTMHQMVEGSQVKTIQTEYLEIDLNAKLVTTDSPVIIQGEQLIITGQGLEANLNEGMIRLTNQVNTLFKGHKE